MYSGVLFGENGFFRIFVKNTSCMDSNNTTQKNSSWKHIAKHNDLRKFQRGLIIAALLVLIGIIILFAYFSEQLWFNTAISLLTSVFAALICTATLSFYEKKNQLNYGDPYGITDSLTDIADKLALMDTDIREVCTESEFNARIGFDSLYTSSKKATSIFLVGRNLFKKHKASILSRFDKKGYVSRWLFVDPDSKYVEIISKKTNQPVNDIKSMIRENVRTLLDGYNMSSQKGSLEVYYMKFPPMQAVYVFDNAIYEFKYYSSSNQIPDNYVLIYDRGNKTKCIGKSLLEDSKRVIKESKLVYSFPGA